MSPLRQINKIHSTLCSISPRGDKGLTIKVIVTGFDAFGGNTVNPSSEAVAKLPSIVKFDDKSEAATVAKLTLPTCCSAAWAMLEPEVEQEQNYDFAVLLAGLAENRDKICLERFALNVRHFRIPDNNGHQWEEDFVCEGAPDAIRSKLEISELTKHLNGIGYAADISHNAGTFVCNETYFRSLHRWQNNPRCRGVLFVHFPPYERYRHSNPEKQDARNKADIYAQSLEEIIKLVLR
ncbi:MAG: pyroglutamyl-peptidase I [Candidatus Obscuribacterales bacterium]|nr:pyroglutamyl-peptidase I [Candidatus Obscuribacterales bacterium]